MALSKKYATQSMFKKQTNKTFVFNITTGNLFQHIKNGVETRQVTSKVKSVTKLMHVLLSNRWLHVNYLLSLSDGRRSRGNREGEPTG